MVSPYCSWHHCRTKPIYYRDDNNSFKRAYGLVYCDGGGDWRESHVDIERGYGREHYTLEKWRERV